MPDKTQTINDLLRLSLNGDSEDTMESLEHFAKLMQKSTSEDRKYLLAQRNAISKIKLNLMTLETKIMHDEITFLLQYVPPATRERAEKIKELVSKGKSNKQIADSLGYSEKTIKRDREFLKLRKRDKYIK